MQASWYNGQAYYRCKFPFEYAVAEDKHAKTVYVRENAIVPSLDAWIAGLFDDEHLDASHAALATASDTEPDVHPDREVTLRRQIRAAKPSSPNTGRCSNSSPT